jgi:hypothetical protein
MSCPPPSTRWRPKWGSSHFYNIDLLLLWLWYCICMHNYHYHYGIVCTIITMTLFACKTMILFLWWGFVMSVTLSYAWIMLIFSLIHHRRTTKTCSVLLPLSSVYRSNWPVTGPYRAVYRSKPNELAFQFGIWIWSVFSGNRGLPTGLPKPAAGGSEDRFGKLNPALFCRLEKWCQDQLMSRWQWRFWQDWFLTEMKASTNLPKI